MIYKRWKMLSSLLLLPWQQIRRECRRALLPMSCSVASVTLLRHCLMTLTTAQVSLSAHSHCCRQVSTLALCTSCTYQVFRNNRQSLRYCNYIVTVSFIWWWRRHYWLLQSTPKFTNPLHVATIFQPFFSLQLVINIGEVRVDISVTCQAI